MPLGFPTRNELRQSIWNRFFRYYWGAIVSVLTTTLIAFFVISNWFTQYLRFDIKGSLAEFLSVLVLALVVGLGGNIFNMVNARRVARGQRNERRELNQFQSQSNVAIKTAIEDILIREKSNLFGRIMKIKDMVDAADLDYEYDLFVFSQDADKKFRTCAATIGRGSQQFEMEWDANEGWLPELLSNRCTILYDHKVISARSLNGAIPINLHEISPANKSKITRELTAILVKPITMPHKERDESDVNKVFGTFGIHTNDPEAMTVLRHASIEEFLDVVGSDIAAWLVMYKSLRDLRERIG
jgi:hypothetical protein